MAGEFDDVFAAADTGGGEFDDVFAVAEPVAPSPTEPAPAESAPTTQRIPTPPIQLVSLTDEPAVQYGTRAAAYDQIQLLTGMAGGVYDPILNLPSMVGGAQDIAAREAELDADATDMLAQLAIYKDRGNVAQATGLADKFKVPLSFAIDHAKDLSAAAERSKWDPRKFRTEPGTREIFETIREVGPGAGIYLGQEKLSAPMRALRVYNAVNDLIGAMELTPRSPLGALWDTAKDVYAFASGKGEERRQEVLSEKVSAIKGVAEAVEPKITVQQASPLRGMAAWTDAYSRERKALESASLGLDQLFLDQAVLRGGLLPNPDDVRRAEANRRDIAVLNEQAGGAQQDYGQGALGQVGIDLAKALASAEASVPALFVGGGAAYLAGPKVGMYVGQAMIAATTFPMETGGAYNEFIANGIDPDLAAVGALSYGAIATGIEMGAFVPQFKALAGLKEAAAAGSGRAWMRSALKDPAKIAALKTMARGMAKSWGSEALFEEPAQGATQDLTGWLLKSIDYGKAQSLDFGEFREKRQTEIYMAGLGAGPMLAPQLVAGFMQAANASKGVKKIEAAEAIAQTPGSSDAPAVAAKLTEKVTGTKSRWVDPQAFADQAVANGADPFEAADAIMDKGAERLRQALAERDDSFGNRATLEVPHAEYNEKWANKAITKTLLQDTASQRGEPTAREQANSVAELKAMATRLASEVPGEETPDVTMEEKAYAKAAVAELVATGRVTEKDARTSVAATRAIIRTAMIRNPAAAAAVFAQQTTQILRATEADVTERALAAHARGLTEEGRLGEQYRDRNTGLLNERGRALTPRDPARPMTARFDFDYQKQINDATGHKAFDGILRKAAAITGTRDATKSGGGLEVDVVDQAHADRLAAEMSKATGVRVLATAVPRAATVTETGTALGMAHDAAKATAVAGGAFAAREAALPADIGALAPDLAQSALGDAAAQADLSPVHAEARMAMGESEALYQTYHEGSGLLNELGFERGIEVTKPRYVASADARMIKALNQAAGRRNTDAIMGLLAEALADLSTEINLAHLHGDEFGAFGDDRRILDAFLTAVQEQARSWVVIGKNPAENGGWVVLDGVWFAHGIATDFDQADRVALRDAKSKQQPVAPRVFGSEADAIEEATRLVAERAGRRLVKLSQVVEHLDSRSGLPTSRQSEIRLLARATAEDLKKVTSPQSAAAANVTARRVHPKPKFRNQGDAYNAAVSALPDGVSPTEQIDSAYARWQEVGGKKPGPYEGRDAGRGKHVGLFDAVDNDLGLTGNKKVSGGREAFVLLMRRADGTREQKAQEAAKFLADNVPGYEKMVLPDEFIEASLDEETNARQAELWEDRERGVGVTSTFYQPAYHGTHARDIEREGFRLNKIGTGEGAQSYGWGMYFAGKKAVAEWYRKNLSSRQTHFVIAEQDALDEVIRRLRSAADKMESQPVGTVPDYIITGARKQADFLEKNGLSVPFTPWRAADMIERYGAGYITTDGIVEQSPGQTYVVEVPEDDELLDYDKPLVEQTTITDKLIASGLLQKAYGHAGSDPVTGEWVGGNKGYLPLTEDETLSILETKKGSDLYFEIEAALDGPEKASAALLAAGIPGLRYLDSASRGQGEGSHNYVIWDESRMPITGTLYQPPSAKGPPRGFIDISKAGMRRAFKIFLTKNSDLSTMLHESAHSYLEMMGDLAEHPEAGEQIKADWATALKELGAATRADLTEEMSETWARSWEAYFMEGKSPSLRLAEVFHTFAIWLKEIYKTLAGIPRVKLNDELRSVFDRMLATDGEIANAKLESGLDDALATEAEAAMNPADRAEHQKARLRAATQVGLRMQKAMAESRLRAHEAYQTDEFRRIEKLARAEFDNRPDAKASRYLKEGKMVSAVDGHLIEDKVNSKLDRAAVVDLLGEKHPIVTMLGKRLAKKDGAHPMAIANMFGYRTGREMLEAVASLPDPDAWVKMRAEEMMGERHPEIEGDLARLRDEVQRILHSDESSRDAILSEADSAGRRSQAGKESKAASEFLGRASRLAAREVVRKSPAGRIDRGGALRRAKTLAAQARVELARGNTTREKELHRQRVVAWDTYQELDAAYRDREKFDKLLVRLGTQKTREILGAAGVLGAVDQVMEAIGAKEREEQPTPRDGAVATFMRLEAGGDTPAVPIEDIEDLVANPPDGGWPKGTIEQMRTAYKILAHLSTWAHAVGKVKVGDRIMELGQINEQGRREASTRKDLGKVGKTVWIRDKQALLLEPMEQVERLGPTLYNAIIGGFQKARADEDDLARDVAKFWAETWRDLPKELRDNRFDELEEKLPIPGDINREIVQDRQFLRMVMFYMGAYSNRERLLGGYQWEEAQVLDWLTRNAKPEEWTFAEAVWRNNENLGKKAFAVYERRKGAPPEKLEAAPIRIDLGDGTFRTLTGGYMPAKYDPIVSRVGQMQRSSALDAYAKNAAAISVQASFVKPRAKKYSDVIRLDWNVVPSHIKSVIHYVAFDEYVTQIKELMNSPEFQETVDRYLGHETYEKLVGDTKLGWLATVANPEADQIADSVRGISQTLGLTRSMMVTSAVGWHFLAAANAIVEGTVASINRGGPSALNTGKAYGRYILDATAAGFFWDGVSRKRALRLGSYVRHRADGIKEMLDDGLREIGNQFGEVRSLHRKVLETAWWFFQRFDNMSTTIIWDAAFRNARDAGMNEADAAFKADDTTEHSMTPIDREMKSAWLRDKGLLAALTVFYGFWSHQYTMVAHTMDPAIVAWDNAEGIKEKAGAAGQFSMRAGQAVAMLAVSVAVGNLIMGHGPEPDETKEEWLLRVMAAAPFQLLPLVGGGAEWAIQHGTAALWDRDIPWYGRELNQRASPSLSIAQKLLKSAGRALDDDRETGDRIWDLMEVLGIPTRTPFGAAAVQRTGRYLTSVAGGYAEDTSAVGFGKGLLLGEKR